mgnify:CR=1 FL=1
MLNMADIYSDEIKRLQASVKNASFQSNEDVRQFIYDLTKLIYDFKMIGLIYDYYARDVEYHKQNKVLFRDVEDVVRNVAEFEAAFPNLRTNIESIIVYQENENFYKVSKRLHYWGNNYGVGKFGVATGKSLANNCMSMSTLHLKNTEDGWKITFEINSDSEAWLEEVQRPDR